jgi:hypothetical protein
MIVMGTSRFVWFIWSIWFIWLIGFAGLIGFLGFIEFVGFIGSAYKVRGYFFSTSRRRLAIGWKIMPCPILLVKCLLAQYFFYKA